MKLVSIIQEMASLEEELSEKNQSFYSLLSKFEVVNKEEDLKPLLDMIHNIDTTMAELNRLKDIISMSEVVTKVKTKPSVSINQLKLEFERLVLIKNLYTEIIAHRVEEDSDDVMATLSLKKEKISQLMENISCDLDNIYQKTTVITQREIEEEIEEEPPVQIVKEEVPLLPWQKHIVAGWVYASNLDAEYERTGSHLSVYEMARKCSSPYPDSLIEEYIDLKYHYGQGIDNEWLGDE